MISSSPFLEDITLYREVDSADLATLFSHQAIQVVCFIKTIPLVYQHKQLHVHICMYTVLGGVECGVCRSVGCVGVWGV